MIFRVLKDGEEVNTVVADEGFISKYCETNGYEYVAVQKPIPVPSTTIGERIAALESAIEKGLSL